MIEVWRDEQGVQSALEEIFEADFLRAHLAGQLPGASEETRARLDAQIPARKLAWGYYRFAAHLLMLDSLHLVGIAIAERDLLACEVRGLVALDRARRIFEGNHPACGACGKRQVNRFGVECPGCGSKFKRKK